MKSFLLLFGLLAAVGCTDDTPVYVCNSGHAKRYHYRPDCRGLSNCTYTIKQMTRDEACQAGKTLCKFEDR